MRGEGKERKLRTDPQRRVVLHSHLWNDFLRLERGLDDEVREHGEWSPLPGNWDVLPVLKGVPPSSNPRPDSETTTSPPAGVLPP